MTKAQANAPETVIFAGCDDGHDSTKLEVRIVQRAGEEITELQKFHLSMPSKVVRGSRALALVSDDASSGIYQVTGENGAVESFTVTDALSGNDLIDTRSINYPVSSVNRVLVHDALIRAKLGGQDVHLVTGLPVNDYYTESGQNKDLIEQKRKNLLEGIATPLVKSIKTAKIVEHLIACEGIAAVYDLAIKEDGSDDPDFFRLLEQAPVGVIDIGGKTIDLAVVYLDRGRHQVDKQRTKSIDFGMLRFMSGIKDEIRASYQITDISPRAMFKILTDRQMMLQGEVLDVSKEVQTALAKMLPDLFERIRSVWGNAHDLSKIIVVGGGAYLLASEIKDGLYRHAESRQDPEYANSRGMLKMSMRNYLSRVRRESQE